MDYIKLGQRIREERVRSNITQEKLAEYTGLSAVYISQIERGRRKLSLDTLVKISNRLKVSIDRLMIDSIELSSYADLNDLAILLKGRTCEEISFVRDMVKTMINHLKDNTIVP